MPVWRLEKSGDKRQRGQSHGIEEGHAVRLEGWLEAGTADEENGEERRARKLTICGRCVGSTEHGHTGTLRPQCVLLHDTPSFHHPPSHPLHHRRQLFPCDEGSGFKTGWRWSLLGSLRPRVRHYTGIGGWRSPGVGLERSRRVCSSRGRWVTPICWRVCAHCCCCLLSGLQARKLQRKLSLRGEKCSKFLVPAGWEPCCQQCRPGCRRGSYITGQHRSLATAVNVYLTRRRQDGAFGSAPRSMGTLCRHRLPLPGGRVEVCTRGPQRRMEASWASVAREEKCPGRDKTLGRELSSQANALVVESRSVCVELP